MAQQPRKVAEALARAVHELPDTDQLHAYNVTIDGNPYEVIITGPGTQKRMLRKDSATVSSHGPGSPCQCCNGSGRA